MKKGKKQKNRPMSTWEDKDLDSSMFDTQWESDNTGGQVKVTRYEDGSSTYHFGGPCGPMHFDENGEEC